MVYIPKEELNCSSSADDNTSTDDTTANDNTVVTQENRSPLVLPSGCLSSTVLKLSCKGIQEKKYYSFDLSNRMISGDTISKVEVYPNDDTVSGAQATYDKQTFKVLLAGGDSITNVGILFIITTLSGEILEFTCVLPIRPEGVLQTGLDANYVMGGQGPSGKGSLSLDIGTVTTLAPDEKATAEIVHGADGNDTLNLGLVKGEVGDKGEKGESYANDGAVDLNVKSINSSATVATDATPYATIENTVNTAHLSRDFLLPNRPIEHVMHKGGAGGITENTVFNARNSYNADPNISFEFDIQSTATDGKFIIWHDDRTQTMLDKDIEVQTSTYDDLRALRFKGLAGTPYADMPMSSLEDWCEFLAQVNRPFYPEIKRYQTLDQVTQMVNIVKSYGLSKLATWENGSLDVLKHVRSIDPDVGVGYLDFYPDGQNLDNAIKAMQEMGNGCLIWQIDRLDNKENVQKIHDAGVRVCGWTASENTAYLKARGIGLTTITCDYTPTTKAVTGSNNIIPITDSRFKSFKKAAVIGTGVITDNSDGSVTFSSSDTNSNCYMYWLKPAVFGETIKLKVKAQQLSGVDITDISKLGTCPRFAIQLKAKDNSTIKRAVDGYVTTSELGWYELSFTINQPVIDGDLIVCSFGQFRPSTITGVFSEAQILMENSSLPVRREVIGGLLNITASESGTLPTLNYNLNYNLLQPDNITWLNSTTIQITDSRLKGIDGTQMSPLWNCDVLLNDTSTSDFYKYRVYVGYLNRSTGTINIQLFDSITNAVVDFKTDKTTLVPLMFNIFNI